MIKPQYLPSHFELLTEGWSNTHLPFKSNLTTLELPALPMDNPIPPTLTSKATPTEQGHIPVSSTGEMKPSFSSDPVIPSTPR